MLMFTSHARSKHVKLVKTQSHTSSTILTNSADSTLRRPATCDLDFASIAYGLDSASAISLLGLSAAFTTINPLDQLYRFHFASSCTCDLDFASATSLLGPSAVTCRTSKVSCIPCCFRCLSFLGRTHCRRKLSMQQMNVKCDDIVITD